MTNTEGQQISEARRWEQFMRDFGYGLAVVVGILMIFVATVLAALARSEPALIWMGGILVIAGVFGERIRTFKLSGSGVEGTLDPAGTTNAFLDAAALRKVKTGPAVAEPVLEALTQAPGDRFALPIGGSYWSAPVVAKATFAASSNSSPELTRRLADLMDEVEKPGAFNLSPPSESANAGP